MRAGRRLAATSRSGPLAMLVTGLLLGGSLLAVLMLGQPAAHAGVDSGIGMEAPAPEPQVESAEEVADQPVQSEAEQDAVAELHEQAADDPSELWSPAPRKSEPRPPAQLPVVASMPPVVAPTSGEAPEGGPRLVGPDWSQALTRETPVLPAPPAEHDGDEGDADEPDGAGAPGDGAAALLTGLAERFESSVQDSGVLPALGVVGGDPQDQPPAAAQAQEPLDDVDGNLFFSMLGSAATASAIEHGVVYSLAGLVLGPTPVGAAGDAVGLTNLILGGLTAAPTLYFDYRRLREAKVADGGVEGELTQREADQIVGEWIGATVGSAVGMVPTLGLGPEISLPVSTAAGFFGAAVGHVTGDVWYLSRDQPASP